MEQPTRFQKLLLAASALSGFVVIVLAIYVGFQVNKFMKAIQSIPTPAPVTLEINVDAQTEEATDNATIILGNASGAMHVCKSSTPYSCESVTLFFGNGNMDALWTREINSAEGAVLVNIFTTSEDGMYVALVSQNPSGLQEIDIVNSSFMVTETLKLDPADYGTITSISGMILDEYGTLTNMIIVTDKGHHQYHIGNGTPAIDFTVP